MSYTNADGLYILTNGDEGVPLDQGTINGGVTRGLVVDIDLTRVGTSFGAANFTPQWPVIPARSVITRATLVMLTAATSGGAATLDIGTYNASTGAAVAATGIDAAIALGAMDAVGEVVRCDGATAVGTVDVGTADVVIGPVRAVAAYTAGRARLYVEYVEVL
jgi:hypothetical protein